MIYITQLIYLKEGAEDIFNQFENIAMPIIPRYNGKLLLRIRPEVSTFIEANIERPYEIHFVEFETEEDFKKFMQDDERKKFVELKNQSIKTATLIKGTKI